MDGGHNPQCIQALEQNIRDYLPGRPLTVLTGVMQDKDYHCMYRGVAPYANSFITVTPDNPGPCLPVSWRPISGSWAVPPIPAAPSGRGWPWPWSRQGLTARCCATGPCTSSETWSFSCGS
ncbi:MAG: hypothetical protein ACLR5H_07690 [Oscillospiraceae bacterium]